MRTIEELIAKPKPRQDWETPPEVFEHMNKRFNFTLDAAANEINHKCEKYYTVEQDGLKLPWDKFTWLNPPYDKIGPWAYKAIDEAIRGNTTVMLVPSNRSDQQWWHDIMPYCDIEWIRGRVKFVGATGSPPFAVCYLIVRGMNTI